MTKQSQTSEERLKAIENEIVELRFLSQLASTSSGLGVLYHQQEQIEQGLVDLRAQAIARINAFQADVTEIKGDLAELLRRVPAPEDSATN